jgi:hypothetical protein
MLDIQRKVTGGLSAAFEVDTVMETMLSGVALDISSLRARK